VSKLILSRLLISILPFILLVSPFTKQDMNTTNTILYEKSESGLTFDSFYGNIWKAQTFTPATTHYITKVRLRLKISGNPRGDVIVSIRTTDANGEPTGDDLANDSIPCADITDNVNWYDFNFGQGYLVETNSRYAICWRATSADIDNVVWYMYNSSGLYPSGWSVESDDAGVSWTDINNKAWDDVFEEWGDGDSLALTLTPPIKKAKIVGYISGWSLSRILLRNIEVERLTHLIYEGVKVTSSTDPTLYTDWDWKYISETISTGHAKKVKVLISLYCSGPELSSIVNSDTLLPVLVTNIKTLIKTYNADGIDIDWESGEPQAEMDKLVVALFDALHPLDKLITIAASWYRCDVSLPVSSYVDFISLMTYGMNNPHHLPYHSLIDDSIAAMYMWSDAGYPKNKLLMGIPFFAEDNNGIVATYANVIDELNPASDQNQAKISSIKAWDNLVNTVDGGILWWNGLDLVKEKVVFIKNNGFGGVMVFDIGEDKLGDPRSLLQNIYDDINTTSSNNPRSSFTPWIIAIGVIIILGCTSIIVILRHINKS